MRNVVDKVSGSVTAATRRLDKIALEQVQTMEAKTTEQDAAPPEDQENQLQTKKRDCKLLVCSIFMIMIVTFHVDSCFTIIYISLSLSYHFILFYLTLHYLDIILLLYIPLLDTQELDDFHLEGLDDKPRAEPSRSRGGRSSSRR